MHVWTGKATGFGCKYRKALQLYSRSKRTSRHQGQKLTGLGLHPQKAMPSKFGWPCEIKCLTSEFHPPQLCHLILVCHNIKTVWPNTTKITLEMIQNDPKISTLGQLFIFLFPTLEETWPQCWLSSRNKDWYRKNTSFLYGNLCPCDLLHRWKYLPIQTFWFCRNSHDAILQLHQ